MVKKEKTANIQRKALKYLRKAWRTILSKFQESLATEVER